MKRLLRSAAAAAFLALTVSAAHAAVVITESVDNGTAVAGQGIFSTHSGATTIDFGSGAPGFTGGSIVAGSLANNFATPFDDGTSFFTIGSPIPGGGNTSTFTTGVGLTYFGLYWGSVDSYNSIAFLDKDGNTIASFNGPVPNDGNQGAGGSRWVEFAVTGGTFQSVLFTSNSPAFEIDNVAYVTAAVPEPSTWAMMILGFFGLGFMAYRRKGTAGAFRFA
jgi:PEP-CTERM motif